MVQCVRSRREPGEAGESRRAEDPGERGGSTERTDGREEVANAISLPSAETFAVLGNDRRRAAISVLAREGEARSVEALARAVAARELERPPAHVTDRQHKCVYVSLLQIHLPRLAAEGLIEWDGSGASITAGESIGALAAVIDLLAGVCEGEASDEGQSPW